MKLFFCFFVFLIPLPFLSQQGLNNALKMRLAGRHDLNQIYNILVQGDMKILLSRCREFNVDVNYYAGDIASINCALKDVPQLVENKVIRYAEFIEPRKRPLDDTMLYKNRLKGVKLWTAPLPQAYNGEGILLGFIDTGIDFKHEDFKDSIGKSRIRFIWDQVPVVGSSIPSPFNYGIEWRKGQIDSGQCTHSDVPYYGHGTHVAGVAAGNARASGRHDGCASRSDMVVVALNFNKSGPTVADAVKYIVAKATAMGKPFVINASLGDYYGSHDGTDLEAKLIENLVANIPGRAMVAAVGNAGNVKYHVKTTLQGDTAFTWIKNSGNQLNYWCYGDTSQVKNIQFSVGANRYNYSSLGNIGFKNYNYALTGVKNDTLKYNGKRIGIVRSSSAINSYGVYELAILIDADSSGLLWRIESSGSGLHHAWNFDFISFPLPGQLQYPWIVKYAMPDTMYSMVSSFQCSEEIITVANYVNLSCFYDVNGVLRYTGDAMGYLANTSSKGPTRNGRLKPDVSATGHGLFSALPLTIINSLLANTPSVVAQGSMHVISGGSSAASPVVAGLAALYLQRFPNATNRQVRDAIRYCAYSDNYTGLNLPNYEWGFGKLDGKAAMYCGQSLPVTGIDFFYVNSSAAFPNPFHDKAVIDFGQDLIGEILVYSADGKVIFKDVVKGNRYELYGEKLPLNCSGLLLARINGMDVNRTYKLIRE